MNQVFMSIKRIILPTMCMLVLVSSLSGCGAVSKTQANKLLSQYDTITLEIPVEATSTQKEITYTWTELAFKTSHSDLRSSMDDILYIIPQGQGGKNGAIYVNEEKQHTNNSTLKLAFNNKKFINNYFNNTDVNKAIAEASKQYLVSENTSDKQAVLLAYANYFEIFDSIDTETNTTLNRLEMLKSVYVAETPVKELEKGRFVEKVADGKDSTNELALYAQYLDSEAYINTSDNSLNSESATSIASRAEFVYLIANHYYKEDLQKIDNTKLKEYSKAFSDLQNAGEVSKNFIYKDKENNNVEVVPDKLNFHTLSYCISNADKGVDENIFKAYIILSEKGIIDSAEDTNWDLALDRVYFMDLITRVYENLGGKINCDRGESKYIEKEETSTSTDKTAGKIDEMGTVKFEQDAEEGAWITEDLINELLCHPFFEGCDSEQVKEALLNPADTLHISQSVVDRQGGVEGYWKLYTKPGRGGIKAAFDDSVNEFGDYYLPEVKAQKKAEAEASKPGTSSNNTQTQTQTGQNTSSNQNTQSSEKVDIGINDSGYEPDPGDDDIRVPNPEGHDFSNSEASPHDWR